MALASSYTRSKVNEKYTGAEFDKPREACGVFGIYSFEHNLPVAQLAFAGLQELQHRGQDAAGIIVNTNEGLVGSKGPGLLSEVFTDGASTLDAVSPEATVAVGHVRYGTHSNSGFLPERAAQPMLGDKTTFALSHNGHIANIEQVGASYGISPDQYMTDSECVAMALDKISADNDKDILQNLQHLLPQLEGAFCLTITDGKRLIAARDTNGFRPLSIGKRLEEDVYIVASETPAISAVGASFVRDVEAGEIVVIDELGIQSHSIDKPVDKKACAFEYVYFSRPDSTVEGQNVHLARERMGRRLAQESPVDADIVIGVPDSGMSAALGFSKETGIPLEMGLFKSPYTSRTFIASTQQSREQAVRRKLRPNHAVIDGRRLVVVDDSIVRGTTMRTLVGVLREAGASEVHLRIPSPPYKWPCYYGMDTGRPEELLARKMNHDEMSDYLGVNSVEFISEEGLKEAIALPLGRLCMACVNGKYPTPIPIELTTRPSKSSS